MSSPPEYRSNNEQPLYTQRDNPAVPPSAVPAQGVEPQQNPLVHDNSAPVYSAPAPIYAAAGDAPPDHYYSPHAPPLAPQYSNELPRQAAPVNHAETATSPPIASNMPMASVRNSGHSKTSAMTNAGALGGMAVGMADGGGSMVGDMVTGMVVGNIVGQRVHQHEVRQEARLAAASGIPPDTSTRAGKRAAKRSKRYERRAKRGEKIKKLFGGGSSSSESESDKQGKK